VAGGRVRGPASRRAQRLVPAPEGRRPGVRSHQRLRPVRGGVLDTGRI